MLFAYLVGVVVATVGCFWQSGQSVLGSLAIPIGLVAALFVTWLGGQIVVTSTSQRWAPTAYAVAFIQMVLTLTATTAAGDVVVVHSAAVKQTPIGPSVALQLVLLN